MASIDKRPDGKWRARWREHPGGPQKTKGFVRKGDAEKFLATVVADLARGTYIDPAAGAVTLEDYAEDWRKIQAHRPLTAVNVESTLRNHVTPGLGALPLAAIRTSHVQAWLKDRSMVLAPSTVVVAARILSSVLRAAVRDRIIATSPMEGVKVPRAPRRQATPLGGDQLERLCEVAPARYRALIVAGAGLGMREGELLGLTLDHVRFLERLVQVRRQLVLVPGSDPVFAPPKTAASVRDVPLPGVVADALAEHRSTFGTGPDGLVFTKDDGQAIRRNRLNELWRSWTEAAGLEGKPVFHDLRHTYASLLIHHGEDVKTVASRMGHADVTETLRTYAHLWPKTEDRTRQAIDSQLFVGRAAGLRAAR